MPVLGAMLIDLLFNALDRYDANPIDKSSAHIFAQNDASHKTLRSALWSPNAASIALSLVIV
jgi:hypothetical protein